MLLATIASLFVVQGAAYAAQITAQDLGTPVTRQISSGGTAQIVSTPTGPDKFQKPEIDQIVTGLSADAATANATSATATKTTTGKKWLGINRSFSPHKGSGKMVPGSPRDISLTWLKTSFNGLTLRQQRLANNGNQFSIEPPDQGLCTDGGKVLEVVNDVVNVYDSHGNSVLGVTALNTFFGYPPEIQRTSPPVFGPEPTDPSCYFDHSTNRWFLIVLTLEVDSTTGGFTGVNHIDIAVTQTADPTGKWTIYHLATQDDGTQGTPNHNCDGGPCLGDYPHLGADAKGFYITTNEYPFFGNGFHAAQIYAFSKLALAANEPSVQVTQIDTIGLVKGNPGFTVWPAISPDTQFSHESNGTEYFLSSDATSEANGTGTSSDLIVWSLSNTDSLFTTVPKIKLNNLALSVQPYSIPNPSTQKAGDFPLGQCLNDATCATNLNGETDPYAPETEGLLDSNDTRMQQVMYSAGFLWSALDTSVTVNGTSEAGIEWFIVKPAQVFNHLAAIVVKNSYYAAADANLTYPAVGVTAFGKGVIAFTLTGPHDFPSAAYTSIDLTGVGPIHVAAAGAGPQDGFTEYKYYGTNGVARPRWGDYGAAVPVGNNIWIASEYSGQTCTLAQYLTNTAQSPLYSCNQTRIALGNWYTRISQITIF
jgi:hypothetical protein